MLNIKDNFGRSIDYLRISITDRCNLRCDYCMPQNGIKQLPSSEILTYDEIVRIVTYAAGQGINRIRITGGEPFVRKDFLTLLERLKKIQGIKDLSLTTNGILLEEYAESIFNIGINRINISLDSLKPERFEKITHKDEISKIQRGIKKALELGFDPVKINMVVIRGMNDNEIEDFADLTVNTPLHLRFISYMPVGLQKKWSVEKYISAGEIKKRLNPLYPAEKIRGNGPAMYFMIKNAKGTIGFIDCIGDEFCMMCNRLRLTADGKLRSCLFKEQEVDIKTALRSGCSDDELEDIFRRAITAKPKIHPIDFKDLRTWVRTMSGIGG